ncbi:MAG: DMT family transporter [Candidatus Heimdallarchaeota archaeon]|nr:DMT family transporter [Candidatus Heimdallarchaeota archaeon]
MQNESKSINENKKGLLPYLLLFIAIIAVSFAAPIVSVLQSSEFGYNVPSEVIAMYRTLFAGIIALIFALSRGEIKWIVEPTTVKRLHWIIISGILLAIHFATWFLSLEYVSVAISTTLVDTVPIFMAIFGFVIFKEKINWLGITGIIFAFIGGVLLAFATADDTSQANPVLGIFLALIGALTVTFYFLIGKKILQDSPLWPYFGLVNLISGISLLIYNIIRGYDLFEYTAIAFAFILLMAIGPSLIGHATYNYSLRRLPAYFVGTVIVAEPVGATILGIVILNEIPLPITVLYMFVILLGIAITSISQTTSSFKKIKLEDKKVTVNKK